ncbi:LuxR C-terminal-related transcriptional regulator [Streptomyces sp. NPDC088354]|uniref:helix-turn-helix transcriptional regulator n=1 Tax=unclassified Streptomyces TaxID=2593676 RepID=UPI0029AD41CF|nr:response regulator transcription factor [Streptomyces sp. MI02-7b]MDX3072657.1 response regulator transcription factor [Streptomyces sp. MI02-7b]
MAQAVGLTLFVLHSSPLIRKALLDLFQDDPGITVLGALPAFRTAHDIPPGRPDVMLVEHEQWPRWRDALMRRSGTRVVLYSRDNTPRLVVEGIRSGVAGFVHESCPPEVIVKALHDVFGGGTFWYLGDEDRPGRPVPGADVPPQGTWQLSGREEQVLALLLRRRSNEEIADELVLTRQTVKNYASRVFRKVGVSGRKELFQLIEAG